jgi:hypothetical protein
MSKENLIAYPKMPQTLKEQIDAVATLVEKAGNVSLSTMMGEIKGLYSAYELSGSSAILEQVAFKLAEIIKILLSANTAVVASTPATKAAPYKDLLSLFRYFYTEILKKGKSGAYNYSTAFKKIIRAYPELYNLLCSLDPNNPQEYARIIRDIINLLISIEHHVYNTGIENDDHGLGIASLRAFIEFLSWLLESGILVKFTLKINQ